jgi:uncharacterized protein (TIGR02118 family)
MISVVSVYADRPGARFDMDYFLNRHLPLVQRLLGDHGLLSLRVVEGKATLDGGPGPYRIVSELTFASPEAFGEAMSAHGAALAADTANYTDLEPAIQFSEVLSDWRSPAP